MSTRVRDADVRQERAAIVRTLIESLADWTDERKYDWLYLDNPAGVARCWVLEDDTGEIAGVSTAFPRRVVARDREVGIWVLGDFCVSPKLRSLGPALRLQRPAIRAVDEGEVDAWYDFPSRSMAAVYRRMGVEQGGELVRLVYLLRADRAIEERVGGGALAKGLGAAGNLLLASRAALGTAGTLALRVREVDFETAPPAGYALEGGVSLDRSAAYLNWRYRRDPRGGSVILEDADGAAIVYRTAGDDVEIVDLIGVRDEERLRGLVAGAIDVARDADATAVSLSVSTDHPWLDPIAKLGFRKRETAPFMAHVRSGAFEEPTPWFLLSGDRDL